MVPKVNSETIRPERPKRWYRMSLSPLLIPYQKEEHQFLEIVVVRTPGTQLHPTRVNLHVSNGYRKHFETVNPQFFDSAIRIDSFAVYAI
jgi:hypothetical protein